MKNSIDDKIAFYKENRTIIVIKQKDNKNPFDCILFDEKFTRFQFCCNYQELKNYEKDGFTLINKDETNFKY